MTRCGTKVGRNRCAEMTCSDCVLYVVCHVGRSDLRPTSDLASVTHVKREATVDARKLYAFLASRPQRYSGSRFLARPGEGFGVATLYDRDNVVNEIQHATPAYLSRLIW